jgi:sugar-specific transcriptional regulator TrmB
MENFKELEQFDLTQTESKIYVLLLKLGSVKASDIIKKAQLHRTTVYDVLERLIEKGLVSVIEKDDIKYFEAAPPAKFLDKIEEEKNNLIEKEKTIKNIVKDLEKIKNITTKQSNIRVYYGKEGLKTVMEDIISEGKSFVGYGGELRFTDILPKYTEIWAEQRRKKKIYAKLIGSGGTKEPRWKFNELKSVSKDYFSPASTLVYGNKVIIILIEEPILIIQIEGEKIARSYRAYFNLLWEIAKKL